MKKTALFLALLIALSLLCGCGKQHVHEWEDATCTEPETCATCGETRGEALGHRWRGGSCEEPQTCVRCGKTQKEAPGHDWQSATCEEPETCARCGETRGEALGHNWQGGSCTEPAVCARCGQSSGEPLGHDAQPADYWSASVCARCGEEVAPKLKPDFKVYGLDEHFIKKGKTYDYRTVCYEDNSFYTVAKAKVTRYDIVESDGDLRPAKDGYEWRIATIEIVFSDENANNYGMSVGPCTENYYNVREHDDTLYEDGDYVCFEVTYKGQTYLCRMTYESSFSEWKDDACTWTCTYFIQVPVGYDGMVIGVRNKGVFWPTGAYCYDLDNTDTLYFRMK